VATKQSLAAAGRFVEVSKTPKPSCYGYGIHTLEYLDVSAHRYPYYWLSKRAVLRIHQSRPDLEFSVRNILGEGHPIAVTICVNGRQVDHFTLGDRNWRLRAYRLPETIHSQIKLEILSDYDWTPAPPDRRRLAIQAQLLNN